MQAATNHSVPHDDPDELPPPVDPGDAVGLVCHSVLLGPRFWNVADFKGRPLPVIGSWTSALETPPGKLLPLPVGPEGEVGTVSHWICPCATKIVENKGGKADKYVIVLSASH